MLPKFILLIGIAIWIEGQKRCNQKTIQSEETYFLN